MRHVCVSKLVLRNPGVFEYFDSSAACTFGATHLSNKKLAFCPDSSDVLLFQVAPAHLSCPARPKSELLSQSFYYADYKYIQPLCELVSAIRSFNNETFAENGLTRFLASEVLFTRTMTTAVLSIF